MLLTNVCNNLSLDISSYISWKLQCRVYCWYLYKLHWGDLHNKLYFDYLGTSENLVPRTFDLFLCTTYPAQHPALSRGVTAVIVSVTKRYRDRIPVLYYVYYKIIFFFIHFFHFKIYSEAKPFCIIVIHARLLRNLIFLDCRKIYLTKLEEGGWGREPGEGEGSWLVTN